MIRFLDKIYIFFIIGLLLIGLAGCSSGNISEDTARKAANEEKSGNAAQEEAEDPVEKAARELYESVYPVYIGISYKENFIFNKDKELSLYVDGEKIKKLKQGEAGGYGFILPKGLHTVAVANNILNADLKTFTVGEDKILGKEAANIFVIGVAFKNGSAEITDFIGTNIDEYSSAEEAELAYYERLLAICADFTAVDDFDAILEKYLELHPQEEDESYEPYDPEDMTLEEDDPEGILLDEYDEEDSEDDVGSDDEEYEEDRYSDNIFPYSDSEYLDEFDLESLSAEECRIARNEIYARHGRRFDDANLQAYFDDCSWYEGKIDPEDFSDDVLNEVEKANLQRIVEYEKEMEN